MKKVLVAVAMILGMGTSVVFAQQPTELAAVETTQQVEFTKIEAKDLPVEITNALAKDYEGAIIKEAFVANKPEGKVFKVIITAKDGKEVTALLNEKGELAKG